MGWSSIWLTAGLTYEPLVTTYFSYRRNSETYLARGVVQQLLEVGDTEVGNTNVADLAGTKQFLHLAPGIDEVPVVVVFLEVVGTGRARPVHEVEINIVETKVFQGSVDTLGDALVPGVVEFGGDPDLLARYARSSNSFADFGFVTVGKGRVDISVAYGDGMLYCLGGFILGRLPSS